MQRRERDVDVVNEVRREAKVRGESGRTAMVMVRPPTDGGEG
jgi:hypothetical protein